MNTNGASPSSRDDEPVLLLRVDRERRDLGPRDLAGDLVGRLLGELHPELVAVGERPAELVVAVEQRDLGDRRRPRASPRRRSARARAPGRHPARAAPPAARRRPSATAPMPNARRRSFIAALRPGRLPRPSCTLFDRFPNPRSAAIRADAAQGTRYSAMWSRLRYRSADVEAVADDEGRRDREAHVREVGVRPLLALLEQQRAHLERRRLARARACGAGTRA